MTRDEATQIITTGEDTLNALHKDGACDEQLEVMLDVIDRLLRRDPDTTRTSTTSWTLADGTHLTLHHHPERWRPWTAEIRTKDHASV